MKKKVNKKIIDSKKRIKEEKDKIKIEKKNIKEERLKELRKKKFFRFLLKNSESTYSFSEILIVGFFSLIIGSLLCFCIITICTRGFGYIKYAKDLSKFYEVYETLLDNYYDDIDKYELIDDAINGMMSSVGDIYTGYSNATDAEIFNELVSAEYEGIGCSIQMQTDGVKIIEVFDDSPANKAGLKAGDLIIKVDDIEVNTDTNVNELSNYIKTESNGKISMTISREGKELNMNLVRAVVEEPVVSSSIYEINNKKIGYLNISIFSSGANEQFEKKLNELEKKNIDGLVIDVRDNNGGYLTTVTDIASQLLKKGDIIYQIEKDNEVETTKDKTSKYRDYPIAILVNGNSASASEILASAIKESYGGFVVGTTTYGKGTVQQVKQLSDGSMIKYTVEHWLTPDGNWINDKGVEPTDIVELDENYYSNPVTDNDNQLQKALELVSK